MSDIKVLPDNKAHKEFIIHANRIINNTNETEQTKGLELNIDKDHFCDRPKFKCLIAEIDNKPVGMILYSYFIGQMMEKYYGFHKCLLNKNTENVVYSLN